MKINEQSLKNELVSSIGKEIGGLGLYGQSKNAGLEVANQMSTIKKSLGEDETTEAMGAGSAGGYSQPLFSIKKKEVEEIEVMPVIVVANVKLSEPSTAKLLPAKSVNKSKPFIN